jgi:hypothetical protein
MILVIVFAVAGLGSCWIWSDISVRAKAVFTVLYIASWGFVFVPVHAIWLFPLSQSAFAVTFN